MDFKDAYARLAASMTSPPWTYTSADGTALTVQASDFPADLDEGQIDLTLTTSRQRVQIAIPTPDAVRPGARGDQRRAPGRDRAARAVAADRPPAGHGAGAAGRAQGCALRLREALGRTRRPRAHGAQRAVRRQQVT
ncbi:hypothetical protein SSBG_02124 [Streptomyces sp. SPB074]|nr:hypothetical protein SSBG_02124 [Streptomyces sp. SPB074]